MVYLFDRNFHRWEQNIIEFHTCSSFIRFSLTRNCCYFVYLEGKITIQTIVMQYHQACENVDMMDNIDIPVVQPLLLPDHSQIKQIRQFLMILLCICLVSLYFEKNNL